MTRVTAAGGVVATCQWDFANGMPMLAHFWEAVSVAHPLGDAEREAKRRVPPGHTSEASLAKLWDVCGLSEIATASLEVPLSFAGFEDYWRPFLSGATPTSTYAAGLPPGVQDAIKAELRQLCWATTPTGPSP